jgi:hypothetical protein
MVFHFFMPKGMQPNGLSHHIAKGTQFNGLLDHIAKGDTAQWSFVLLCQRGRSPVVFHFTFSLSFSHFLFSFHTAKGEVAQWSFISHFF